MTSSQMTIYFTGKLTANRGEAHEGHGSQESQVLTNSTDSGKSVKASSYSKLKFSTKLSGVLMHVVMYYCPTNCAEAHRQ